MLPAVNRMRRTEEFRSTVRRGVRVGRPLVVVHVLSTSSTEPSHVGFVVGRSIGGAVIRNALRRRLRHLMRDRLATLPTGSQLVVRAHPAAASVPGAVLERELDEALTKALVRAGAR